MAVKLTGIRKASGLLILLPVFALLLYCWPAPDGISSHSYSTVLYSEDGVLLSARIAEDEQWRFPPPESLPEKYVTALLTFEDRRFFSHPGIDPLAIVRAIKSNISSGKVVSGASTITMQLARLLLGNQPRTYWQKFKEMLVAFRLEMHFSKNEILTLYATHAPFGGNNVGVAAANWRYFGHDLSQITWSQAALLAVLPNAPSIISPGKNRDKLLLKRNALLDRLYRNGALDSLDLKLAKLEPLPDRPMQMPNRAPHLLARLAGKYPHKTYLVSTLDANLQQQVDGIAENHIARLGSKNINNLSILVLDNFEHKTLAYIGNKVFEDNLTYSPSVDVIQRPRSSGSLFKPFLFAAMLQSGHLTPDTLVLDVPSYYNGYSPENYDRSYRGAVSAQHALIESLNVPSVKLLQDYGVGLFKQDLLEIGLTTLFRSADDYGLSLILGGAETTLWDITNAYAGLTLSAFGRGKEFIESSILRGTENRPFDYPLKQGASWLTLQSLTQVRRPGIASAWREFASSQQIAWKTGTSYGWHDAWAVGSNGRYTVGVWAGNANGEEGRDLTGSKAAAPVMLDVFQLLSGANWPEKPSHALKTLALCQNDGYLPAQDCEVQAVDVPRESDFTRTSPFHRRVFLDSESGQRVHSGCESVFRMKTQSYFVLPPVADYYYRKVQPNQPVLPVWREDCQNDRQMAETELPMQLEYPVEGARIKIPVQLDGEIGRAVFKARHQMSSSILHWHLNEAYLGKTQYIHEKAVAVNAGWHRLVLVDEQGHRLQRWFKVL